MCHVVFTDFQLREEPQGWLLALKPTFDKGKCCWIPAQLKVISILLLYYMQIFLAHKNSITWSMHPVSAKEMHACRDIARVYRLIRRLINSPLLHLLCPYFPLTFPLAVFSLLHPYLLSTDWGEKVCFFTLNNLKSAVESLICHHPVLADPWVHRECLGVNINSVMYPWRRNSNARWQNSL